MLTYWNIRTALLIRKRRKNRQKNTAKLHQQIETCWDSNNGPSVTFLDVQETAFITNDAPMNQPEQNHQEEVENIMRVSSCQTNQNDNSCLPQEKLSKLRKENRPKRDIEITLKLNQNYLQDIEAREERTDVKSKFPKIENLPFSSNIHLEEDQILVEQETTELEEHLGCRSVTDSLGIHVHQDEGQQQQQQAEEKHQHHEEDPEEGKQEQVQQKQEEDSNSKQNNRYNKVTKENCFKFYQ